MTQEVQARQQECAQLQANLQAAHKVSLTAATLVLISIKLMTLRGSGSVHSFRPICKLLTRYTCQETGVNATSVVLSQANEGACKPSSGSLHSFRPICKLPTRYACQGTDVNAASVLVIQLMRLHATLAEGLCTASGQSASCPQGMPVKALMSMQLPCFWW